MQVTRCPEGHFYDGEKFMSCPYCAEKTGTVQQSYSFGGAVDNGGYSRTEPIATSAFAPPSPAGMLNTEAFRNSDGAVSPVSETVPISGMTGAGNAGKGMEDYGSTLPVGVGESETERNGHPVGFNPVTGWLVCIDGAGKGTDYRVHGQYNYIGRAKHMDICIAGDNYISSEKAAVLAYDEMEKQFYLAPGQGHNLVRLNGKMVMGTELLKAYDRITIGKTTLLFIPLCGDSFDWKNC